MATDAANHAGAAPHQGSSGSAVWGGRFLRRDFSEILSECWNYRELLHQLTLRDIRIRYKQALMGLAWALLMPGLVILGGLVVRFAMARLAHSHLEGVDVEGMAIKALAWSFFVGAIGFATSSLTGNMALITKVYFPREVLPLSAIFAQGFDSLIGGVTLVVVLSVFGVRWSWAWAWVVLLALLLVCFTAAAALFLSCANLFFRDVKYIVQVFLMFGIFFTPVFFEPAMLGRFGGYAMLNPLAPILEGLRLAMTEGHNLFMPLVTRGMSSGPELLVWSPWLLAYAAAWAIGGLFASALLFHRLALAFAEYV